MTEQPSQLIRFLLVLLLLLAVFFGELMISWFAETARIVFLLFPTVALYAAAFFSPPYALLLGVWEGVLYEGLLLLPFGAFLAAYVAGALTASLTARSLSVSLYSGRFLSAVAGLFVYTGSITLLTALHTREWAVLTLGLQDVALGVLALGFITALIGIVRWLKNLRIYR